MHAAGDIVMPAELLDGETEELHHVARRRRGQVVHRDPVAGLERGRHRHLLDVCEEGGAVHGAEDPIGCDQSSHPERAAKIMVSNAQETSAPHVISVREAETGKAGGANRRAGKPSAACCRSGRCRRRGCPRDRPPDRDRRVARLVQSSPRIPVDRDCRFGVGWPHVEIGRHRKLVANPSPVAGCHRREARQVSLPTTPHDALFRALVANPARAGALLAEYLPKEVADLLDPDTPPEAVEGSFVDADAARTQCDALFRVRLKTGHQARIYVLLEHKSNVDASTPLQILKYMVNIWLREIEDGIARDRLPPIIPLIFYHGQGRWTVARSVAEMIEAPEVLAPFLREFAYVLHDLGEIAPPRLSRTPEVRAGLLALKVVHADAIPPDILDQMTGGPVAGSEFERHIIRYIAERMNLTPPLLEASLRRTKPDRWEALMGTVAEAWIEQGRAEGIERGRTEGRTEGLAEGRTKGLAEGRTEGLAQGIATGQAGLLLRQLELRFGDLPDTVRERVHGASASELEAWAAAVLVAASLDEALAARPGP